ncbi:gfo/Idh/MocA family oxidoreductase [Phenylobacterium hankyongense]|uniref:Gfo/Idh/MocA family oxidoreductase n=1 Tax=Phenylobacterium hankyongense TaxID=1813876 RepID=A0A328B1Q9_9CAUL|nr:Gfo/Idh/MocA family oxidoreductase [Phenylobacterium hankyongense]RAK61392.1 gfo/Idh/MocA family oxidoreductase [Phenylobacterium hankyongense]
MSEAPAGKPAQGRVVARPRVGFLGVGWIGRHRLEAILEAGAVEVAAIADPSVEMAAEAGRLAPGAALVGTLDDLLDSGVDGVAIASPSALHAEQAIRALAWGAAVFCQKPLGRTADEAQAVVDAARAADRLLCIDLSYRFTEGMRQIRELLAAGELGRVHAVDLVFHNAYGPDKPWFYDPALAGGGCVMDLGVHLVDLALWALDFPQVNEAAGKLFAGGEPLAGRSDTVEDYAVATLELATGAVVRLACSWRLQAGCDAVISASFYGTEGGAALKNLGGSFYDFTAERYRGTARETLASPPDAWGGRAAADWARRLAAGERFDPAAQRLVDVARVLDRIYGR